MSNKLLQIRRYVKTSRVLFSHNWVACVCVVLRRGWFLLLEQLLNPPSCNFWNFVFFTLAVCSRWFWVHTTGGTPFNAYPLSGYHPEILTECVGSSLKLSNVWDMETHSRNAETQYRKLQNSLPHSFLRFFAFHNQYGEGIKLQKSSKGQFPPYFAMKISECPSDRLKTHFSRL